ncbi:BTB/POZ domain-containing protein [Glomus cerebriforme]|uniref:BTB/POZ domain-containing protein n=1 Tax=Glomus cerebriforme TaxID=658196 RepID=A0A397SNZ9_9GLOM|nr:BTB/POZ domain-containing protein [Glomus cerebriforme]
MSGLLRRPKYYFNNKHNYSDGDVIIKVDSILFKVHRNILSLASTTFSDMFTNAISYNQSIPEITLENESETNFENLLSFIYPKDYIAIDWDNVEEMFRISHKFTINSVFTAAKVFLTNKFEENPLLALYLSEKYEFKELFKEASKLVLNNFYVHKKSPLFTKLSINTKLALIEMHHDYLTVLFLKSDEPKNGVGYNKVIELLNEDPSEAFKLFTSSEFTLNGKFTNKFRSMKDITLNQLFIELNK